MGSALQDKSDVITEFQKIIEAQSKEYNKKLEIP